MGNPAHTVSEREAMKLLITIKQFNKKARTVEVHLSDNADLNVLRTIFNVEQSLNALASDTRWHFEVTADAEV